MDGTVNCATQSSAIPGAMITVNAKTELAYASLDGMESIAQSRVVPEGKHQKFCHLENSF